MYKKVYVEITNICNMNCSFCHGHKRAFGQMSKEEFNIILNKLTNVTKYIYYHLMGEPLTHPLLVDFINTANEKGYKSIITTNGVLIKERGGELLNSKLHKINISLHSFENGSKDEFSDYITDIADFSKKAADKGIIVVFRLWNKGFDNGNNDIAINILKNSIIGDWTENTKGLKIRDKIYLEWGERFEWPDKEAEIKGDKYFCYGLKDQFGILVDGTVVPCCLDSDGTINLGNIFKDDIESILNSKRALDMVEGFKNGKASEDICKRCGYAQRFVK